MKPPFITIRVNLIIQVGQEFINLKVHSNQKIYENRPVHKKVCLHYGVLHTVGMLRHLTQCLSSLPVTRFWANYGILGYYFCRYKRALHVGVNAGRRCFQ